MERLTKVIGCPDGTKIYDISNKLLGLNISRAAKTRMIFQKLAEYEDLEDRLNKVYGDCDGLLPKVVEMLEKHPCIDMANNTSKSRLLTDEDVDKWNEYKRLEEQDRLIKLPCRVGADIYYILGIPNEMPCAIESCVFELSDINKIGKTLFLTKSEAEAKLKELRGGENGK